MSVLTCKNYMMECNLHNHNSIIIVLLKELRKTMRHKDATMFLYVHCVPLSISYVMTQSFPVLKVTGENKNDRFLTNEYSYIADFHRHDAV